MLLVIAQFLMALQRLPLKLRTFQLVYMIIYFVTAMKVCLYVFRLHLCLWGYSCNAQCVGMTEMSDLFLYKTLGNLCELIYIYI